MNASPPQEDPPNTEPISTIKQLIETGERLIQDSRHLFSESQKLFRLEMNLAKRGLISTLKTLIVTAFLMLAALLLGQGVLILGLHELFGLSWFWSAVVTLCVNGLLIHLGILRLKHTIRDLKFMRLRALWKGLRS